MYNVKNKNEPVVKKRVSTLPGYAEPIYEWRVVGWFAKNKDGIFRIKDRYIVGTGDMPDTEVKKRFVRDFQKEAKRGRYHNWFFREG
jgi:hypothetical protein